MIIVITGPTCSSKSKIAIDIAKRYNGEIVNADAFQIYKELDIGTAKPSSYDYRIVPHHLYDFVLPNAKYSIFNYQNDARICISSLIKKKKNVILVGGSGLYIKAAIYDFKFNKKKPVDLKEFEKMDNQSLHDALKKIDQETANKTHVNNRRRLLRAIAIFLENNETKSELEKKQKHEVIYKDIYFFVVKINRNELYKKIKERAKKMVDKGLVQEARMLVKKYGKDNNSLKAIGYREVIENPNLADDKVLELIQKNTCHYAKKQLVFIRHQYKNVDINFVRDAQEIIDFIDKHESF
ncbi:MAG: tRNA (adenosine(37)-N6)-dimethylallyltransferase MiaA [Bacilli bacterium]|nr:tRNA (adenosine(37)-N6)-dimethylallyltransferase MiaA [Bacilli bacterium]